MTRSDPLVAPSAEPADIAVVGGGPAGLTAAILFSSLGFSTTLVAPERHGEDFRTTALLGGSLDLVARLGLDRAIAERGAAIAVMRLVDDTGRLIRAPEAVFRAADIGRDAFGVNIANRDLVDLLEARAADGPRRIVGTVGEAVEIDADRVRLPLTGGGAITARLVVAADGRGSRLRRAAGIATREWSLPQSAIVFDLAHRRPHEGVSTEFHTRNGPFVLVPLPGGNRSSVVLIDRPAEIERLVGLTEPALAAEMERRSHSILGAMTPIGERRVWPLSSLVATVAGRRRIALIGETAHAFPPIGAQGLNLTLRDIARLASLVVAARAGGEDIGGARLLAAYDRRRRFDVASRAYGVDVVNRTLLSDLLPAQIFRAVGLHLATALPGFGRLLMRAGLGPRMSLPPAPGDDGGAAGGSGQTPNRVVGSSSWVTR
jgi:2-octaprenyl-6-methoxyphenol hydroxylase